MLVEVGESRVDRRSLHDEPAQAVRHDARPPARIEHRLQRLLTRLLRLEAGPLLVPGDRAVLGRGEIGTGLIEPRTGEHVTSGHLLR